MKKSSRITNILALVLPFLLAGVEAVGQQSPTRTDAAGRLSPVGQVQQRQPDQVPPYFDYSYGSETTSVRTISVSEAVNLALDNAATLRLAQFDELSAEEDVKQARAAMLPQFSMPLTYWGTTPSQVRGPDEPLTFSFVSASAINESIGAISTTGTIDVAGRLRASLHRARALLVAAHAGTLAARRSLALETIDAYYGLVLARQKRRLADETLALATNFVAVTEDQLKHGAVSESDVLRARSAAHSRRDELVQSQLAESIAMNQLRVLTGIDYKTHIAVVRLTDNVPQAVDFLGYREESVMSRPELIQLEAQHLAAREDARAAKRELLPQLTYTLNAGFDAANFKPLGRYAGGAAIVTLNVPIFNFGASKSRETQALLRAKAFDTQRELAVRGLKQEFYAARAGALSALDRIKESREAALAAHQNLTFVYEGYRLNKASLLEVIDAQSNYSLTRLEYYQAIADYYSARARLEADPAQIFARAVQPSPPDSAPPGCSLTREQAPDVGGFRLGMTEAQARAMVPSLAISKPDDLGVSRAEIEGPAIRQLAAGAFFEDVENIQVEFLDGKLSFVRVAYPSTNKWSSKDQFVSFIAPKFRLNARWLPFYDWQTKDAREAQDLRDLGVECAGFRLTAGIGIEGLGGDETPHYELDDLVASRLVKERAERIRSKEKKTNP